MSFKDIDNINIQYDTLGDNVIEDFFIPCLSNSIVYKRNSGFFSSSALVAISRGLCNFVKNGGKMKLMISPSLSKEDYEAIEKGYKDREQDYIDQKFLEKYEEPKDMEEKDRFAFLSYLISSGALEIKVVLIKDNPQNAIFHPKEGIMIDDRGDKIYFIGSNNLTYNGLAGNFDTFDVFCSWKSLDSENRADMKEIKFDNIWDKKNPNVIVLNFPAIIKEKILRYKETDHNKLFELDKKYLERIKQDHIVKNPENIPYYKGKINLFDYQKEVIETWKKNGYRGICDMATGSGKTYVGGAAICDLFEEKKRLFTIIVCPYVHLVDQWFDEMKSFNINSLKCCGAKSTYDKDLYRLKTRFKQKRINFACIITTNGTFMKDKIQDIVSDNLEDILLIVDEAHNFGADKISQTLTVNYPYRLALSATIERYMDLIGTKKLTDFFGKKCITYTLEKAIIEDKLTKYKYYPIIINLTDDELSEYISITDKISKIAPMGKVNGELPEAAKALLIKRARIVAGAANKVSKLIELMKNYKDDNNILIYCGAVKYGQAGYEDAKDEKKQIKEVAEKLNKELGIVAAKFTSEENAEQRAEIKKKFISKDIQALVAIKCLDEGMNIPAIKTAFILASSTNPKEYIQRRGRVLRKFPGKDFAEIYDFITISRPLNELALLSYEAKKKEISLANRELARLEDFNNIAMNSSEGQVIIDTIKDAYNIGIIKEDDDYGF